METKMHPSLVLLIFLCAVGYAGNQKYCESYCNGASCTECARQGKPLPFAVEKCAEYCQQASLPQSESTRCRCPPIRCGPDKNCNCSASCVCGYCGSCKLQTLYTASQCKQACEQAKTPECENLPCPCPFIPCPSKDCNCSASCVCSFCQNCTAQSTYTKSQCADACQRVNGSGCKNVQCGCPAQPSCPSCNCSAACACGFCKKCKVQTTYTKSQCTLACQQSNATGCKNSQCSCPAQPSCPSCNCSDSCACRYCNDCKAQTTYTKSQCMLACQQSNATGCNNIQCSCMAQPSCPSCNCSASCICGYCNDCQTQITYTKSQCTDACKQSNATGCQYSRCGCPALPACPSKTCDCSASCICSYCNYCQTQTTYNRTQCESACKKAKAPECNFTRCGCPRMPACPCCNCSAYCFGPFCDRCPAQVFFPKETCASYAKQYKMQNCGKRGCFCPGFVLPCPDPKNCNCSAACICSYCKSCKTQKIYSNSTCNEACKQSNTLDCIAAKCHCSFQPACPTNNTNTCNCSASCICDYCNDCKAQTTYTKSQCAEACQQKNATGCKNAQCGCPFQPSCPSCNCSASCACGYCNDCKTQTTYTKSQCTLACQQSNATGCKHGICHCPFRPACPSNNTSMCNCSAVCACGFCNDCKVQTTYTKSQCTLACQQSNATGCNNSQCSCPAQLSCPSCNCSASCICGYCNDCKVQSTFTKSQCTDACKQANATGCQYSRCGCQALPACSSKTCDCSASCICSYCNYCKTQTTYNRTQCESACKKAKAPECDFTRCGCPRMPACPSCNCSAACVCGYCNDCKVQTTYTKSQCMLACQKSSATGCNSSQCSCPAQPTCPSCNCSAYCFGPFCDRCPAQVFFPKETCASYAKQYKTQNCDKQRCICPGFVLPCPDPKNCNCSAACIYSYCKSCKTQKIYSNSTCNKACERSNTLDCVAAKCHCSFQPACPTNETSPCNCSAVCQASYCESCPKQIIYPPETCKSFIKEAKSPRCTEAIRKCACPASIPYCPKPEKCDCRAVRISRYCKKCPCQKRYSSSKCQSSYKMARSADCQARKCDLSNLPHCPR